MSLNKYNPHVWIIPEDDANRQLANGFINHEAVADATVEIRSPAGGWSKVLEVFSCEYVPLLRRWTNAHVVMLIDFDSKVEMRINQIAINIPEDVKTRVFLIGSLKEPEILRRELAMSYEKIGLALAADCLKNDLGRWNHPHLTHNSSELQRMVQTVKPFLFPVQ